MTFTIWFVGLIAHVFIDSSHRRAVLINPRDIPHNATIRVICADIANDSQLQCQGSEKTHNFQLNGGRHFIVDAGASGDVKVKPTFDELVPKLKGLVDVPAVISQVTNAKPHKRVSAYVDYSGGCLVATNEGGKELVEFDYPNVHRQGVATRTAYVLESAPASVIIRDDGGTFSLKLRGSATIAIMNAPDDGNTDDHFVDYNSITEATKIARLSRINNGYDDKKPECSPGARPMSAMKHGSRLSNAAYPFITAECTNSQFP